MTNRREPPRRRRRVTGPAKSRSKLRRAVAMRRSRSCSSGASRNRTYYTDLFTLLKVNGHWKIMNKVFHINADSG
jgi:Putative lumazine-binding